MLGNKVCFFARYKNPNPWHPKDIPRTYITSHKGARMRAGYKEAIKLSGISIAVFLGMKYLLPLIFPFLAAWLLVELIRPAALWLEKRFHMKRTVSGCILLAFFTGAACFFFYYLGTQLLRQFLSVAADFNLYAKKTEDFVENCCSAVEQSTGVRAEVLKTIVYQNMEALENKVGSGAPEMLKNSVTWLFSMLEGLSVVLIVFISFVLLLKDYEEIQKALDRYGICRPIRKAGAAMQSLGGAWLRSQLLILLAVTAVCVAGLWLLGYPYALLLGVAIGLLDMLPFIGTGTVLLPWGLFEMFTGRFLYGLCLMILFFAANTLREYLEPKLMGDRLGIWPIAMVAAVYIGLRLYGVPGVVEGPVSLVLILQIYRAISPGKRETSHT